MSSLPAFFRFRGLAPAKRVEADNEMVISALVIGGVGVALMREDLARAAEAAGQVCLWNQARLATELRFVYRAERQHDPVIQGLLQVLAELWPTRRAPARLASRPPSKAHLRG